MDVGGGVVRVSVFVFPLWSLFVVVTTLSLSLAFLNLLMWDSGSCLSCELAL